MKMKSDPLRYMYMSDDEMKSDPEFRDDMVRMFRKIGVENYVFGMMRRAKRDNPEPGSTMMDYHFMAMMLEQEKNR